MLNQVCQQETMLFRAFLMDYSLSGDNRHGIRMINTEFSHIGTHMDARQTAMLMSYIIRGSQTIGLFPRREMPQCGPISRVELFADGDLESRYGLWNQGLVIFDQTGKPFIHVPQAIIGDSTTESYLTDVILEELGVPAHLFQELQERYWGVRQTNQPYNIIIKRQPSEDVVRWQWLEGR